MQHCSIKVIISLKKTLTKPKRLVVWL